MLLSSSAGSVALKECMGANFALTIVAVSCGPFLVSLRMQTILTAMLSTLQLAQVLSVRRAATDRVCMRTYCGSARCGLLPLRIGKEITAPSCIVLIVKHLATLNVLVA